MKQSRLSINVNCSYVRDWNKTLDFLRRLDPVAVVAVIDNLSNRNRILEIQHALPYAKVIARCIIVVKNPDGSDKELDGGMHLAPQAPGDKNHYIVSPANFLNTWGMLGQGGLSLSYMNEPMIAKAQPGDITRQVEHILETISLATEKGISLVIGNWGVGHQLNEQFDDVINAVGNQRDLHSLGCHAYAPVDLTKCIDVVLARCKARNLAKPRIYITEFGWDTSEPGDPLNGYKSRNFTGVSFANWEIDKFQSIYASYVEDGDLEAIATFGWGYVARFPSFDVETDTDWQTTILDGASKGMLSVMVTTPPKPTPTVEAPAHKGIGKVVIIQGSISWNLRDKSDIHGKEIGMVKVGESITIYPSTIQPNGGHNWYYIERANAPAGESANGYIAYILPPTGPLAPKTGYVPTAAQIAMLESWRKQLTDSIAAETAKLAIIDSILASTKVSTGV